MENKKKTVLLVVALAALVLVAALFIGIYNATRPKPAETPDLEKKDEDQSQTGDGTNENQDPQDPDQGQTPAQPTGSKKITVTIIHSDGKERELEIFTDADYLGPVLEEYGLVVFEEGPYGMFILSVDGEKAVYEEDGAYWGLNINGEYALQGADQTPVNNGDHYELVYTIG